MYEDEAYETSHASGFLAGLVLGIAGGVAAAMLYAPASGKDARAYVASRARAGRERAASLVERGAQTVSDGRQALHDSGEILSSALREGREAYQHAKADVP